MPREGVPEGERLIALVLDSVTSPESRRAYGRGLREFLAWLPPRPFTRASVQEYRAHLECRYLLALHHQPPPGADQEARPRGLRQRPPDPARAVAIARVKGVRRHGVRLGNWVGAEEAGRLLASPYTGSLRGKRDRAILAVLLGCALRRSELVALRVEDLQEREGRAVFADIAWKGRARANGSGAEMGEGRDPFLDEAPHVSPRVSIFRAIGKGDRVRGEMTGAAVLTIVRRHSLLAGIERSRRTTSGELARGSAGRPAAGSTRSRCSSATPRSRRPSAISGATRKSPLPSTITSASRSAPGAAGGPPSDVGPCRSIAVLR